MKVAEELSYKGYRLLVTSRKRLEGNDFSSGLVIFAARKSRNA